MSDYKKLTKIVDLLEDIKKLTIFSLYKRDDVTSEELGEVLGLKASTVRGLFARRKRKQV